MINDCKVMFAYKWFEPKAKDLYTVSWLLLFFV